LLYVVPPFLRLSVNIRILYSEQKGVEFFSGANQMANPTLAPSLNIRP
jgi:hypothetical protein